MKAPITTQQAMSHPTVVATINVLSEMTQLLLDENDALKKTLAQPEQEPKTCALLYPQADYVATLDERPWVGLTDEDKDEIIRVTESDHYYDILMLAEAKLKEKNT